MTAREMVGLVRGHLVAVLCLVALGLMPQHLPGQSIVQVQDITFSKGADYELRLDMASPKGGGPFPALVFLCGNSWGAISNIDRHQYTYPSQVAARKGYVGIAIDCRSTGEKVDGRSKWTFPCQIYDAKAAVRWIRKNASAYNIDPERIGVVGWSSGANLALMLGFTKPGDGLEGIDSPSDVSSGVAAVVALGAPTDLLQAYSEALEMVTQDELSAIEDYIGGSPKDLADVYRKASPVSYVTKDAPPTLLVHGDVDFEVRPNQSQILDTKLSAIGASHSLILMKGYGHQNFWNEGVVWDFLKQTLQNQPRD